MDGVLMGFAEASSRSPTEGEEFDSFFAKHERYADADRLSKISCPHAIKAWAAERLPGLNISYGFSNRLPQDVVLANLEERASLRIVEFADNLTMIARFCRKITQLNIDVSTHSQGIEFRFTIHGAPLDERFHQVETKGFNDLLYQTGKDNCLKNRIMATETLVEAQSIVLKKKLRLGISPIY